MLTALSTILQALAFVCIVKMTDNPYTEIELAYCHHRCQTQEAITAMTYLHLWDGCRCMLPDGRWYHPARVPQSAKDCRSCDCP